MSEAEIPADVTALTVQLLSAYLANNSLASDELANLIRTTRAALTESPDQPAVEEVATTYTAAVSARKSLASPDHILSLIDGKPYKTLKRHLTRHGLTPESYRERYNLPSSYPMVAINFAAKRREIAARIGLGKKPKSGADVAAAGEVPVTGSPTGNGVEPPAATARPKAKTRPARKEGAASKPVGRPRKAVAGIADPVISGSAPASTDANTDATHVSAASVTSEKAQVREKPAKTAAKKPGASPAKRSKVGANEPASVPKRRGKTAASVETVDGANLQAASAGSDAAPSGAAAEKEKRIPRTRNKVADQNTKEVVSAPSNGGIAADAVQAAAPARRGKLSLFSEAKAGKRRAVIAPESVSPTQSPETNATSSADATIPKKEAKAKRMARKPAGNPAS